MSININKRIDNTQIPCPYRKKYELVEWLIKYRGFTKSQANRLTKRQCYAIWYGG